MPTDAAAPTLSPRRLRTIGIVILVAALVAVAWGVISRRQQTHAAQTWSRQVAAPTVAVVHPTIGGATRDLNLPGDLAADNAAQIFARTSGYIKAWYKDIGAPVRAGDVLATLDTPDLDQQVLQARAEVASAEANQKLSATTSSRWADLLRYDAVSRQDAEEKSGDLAVKTAQVGAARAALNRLLALKNFARITAPFAGVVTTRNANIGDLVNAGAAAQPLFVVSDERRLRVYVRVPQSESAGLKPGLPAHLTLPEYPGRSFPATLASTSQAINGQSGTLLVELIAANPDGALRPGAFAQVNFDMADSHPSLLLPASALLFRKEGLQVAVLDGANHAHLRRISIARDLGQQVEVATGLSASDRVVDNPPDSIAEGEAVRLAPGHG